MDFSSIYTIKKSYAYGINLEILPQIERKKLRIKAMDENLIILESESRKVILPYVAEKEKVETELKEKRQKKINLGSSATTREKELAAEISSLKTKIADLESKISNATKENDEKRDELIDEIKKEKEEIHQLEQKRLSIIRDENLIIPFGEYICKKGDNKEPINWRVIDVREGKALLISTQAIDCQQYDISDNSDIWESCSLRKWLNDSFLNNAFSTEEQALIQNTVTTYKNWYEPPIVETDKVFLLSFTEEEKYFTSNEERKCIPTDYAVSQGAYTNDKYTKDGEPTCVWWLRKSNNNDYHSAYVHIDGWVYYSSSDHHDNFCVRPALWINLDSWDDLKSSLSAWGIVPVEQ